MHLPLLRPAALPRLAITLAALTVACGESTAPADPRAAVAGTYVLESVDGCALGAPVEQCPVQRDWLVGGTLVLGPDGRAARVVQSKSPADASPRTAASVGTFTVRRGVVDLTLREDVEGTWYDWRAEAELEDGLLTVRYPHPADGWTVEVFRRD